jgi:hypothetical protein
LTICKLKSKRGQFDPEESTFLGLWARLKLSFQPTSCIMKCNMKQQTVEFSIVHLSEKQKEKR